MVATRYRNWTRTPNCWLTRQWVVTTPGQVSPFRQVRRFLVVFNVSNSFRTRGQWLCGACQPCVTTVINDLHTCVGPGKYHLSSPHLHTRLHFLCVFPFTSFSFPFPTPTSPPTHPHTQPLPDSLCSQSSLAVVYSASVLGFLRFIRFIRSNGLWSLSPLGSWDFPWYQPLNCVMGPNQNSNYGPRRCNRRHQNHKDIPV